MSTPSFADIADVRFGFGPAAAARTSRPEDLMAQLGGAATPTASGAERRSEFRLRRYHELRNAVKEARQANAAGEDARKALRGFVRNSYLTDAHDRVLHALNSPAPFFERLVSFWSNHFTVSVRKQALRAVAGPFESEAIRPHVAGRFADLLIAVARHPAMITYLDQSRSIGPNSQAGRTGSRGLNENLAREILELHTLGVDGGYGQADVTEFARLLTGWSVAPKQGSFAFRPRAAEPGTMTILGRRFDRKPPSAEDATAALRMLAAHPSTARHIARRLAVHFIAPDPPDALIRRIADAFTSAGGHLPAAYQALVEAPEAVAQFGAKARQPFEFVVAGLRLTNLGADALGPLPATQGGVNTANPLTVGALADMGQELWGADAPIGWPEDADYWISAAGLAGRLNWISRVVRHLRAADPAELIDTALGPVAGDLTRRIAGAASTREEGLALVLASPEFNRR